MLRNGSTGEEVTALQKALMTKGINPGPIDGIFGPKTDDAVRRFQERAGLEVDGIVGPKTMAALEGKAEKVVPEPAPAADIPVAKKPLPEIDPAPAKKPLPEIDSTPAKAPEPEEEPESPQTAL